jgi:hypothetical protein
MNLSGVIDSLGQSGPIDVTRGSPGTWVNGRYVPGPTSQLTLDAVVAPARARDLKRLPEGQRTEETKVVLTKEALHTAHAPDGSPADRISYGGETYEVVSVEDWSAVAGFWYVLAEKVGQ